jgi:alkylresorcinol/alkylpyrone synthase
MERALGLDPSKLALARESLASLGNLSSASVLHVLARTLPLAKSGDVGVLMAMGPGFCAELVLLSW